MPALDPSILLAAGLYLGLAGFYLLIGPVGLYLYFQRRWYTAGSVERLIAYGLVFVFFPGMLLLAPFLNFRPQRREIQG
jgi:NAD(P)H-quinone oxidoreductase subunit L